MSTEAATLSDALLSRLGGGKKRGGEVWIKVCNVHSALKNEKNCLTRPTAAHGSTFYILKSGILPFIP